MKTILSHANTVLGRLFFNKKRGVFSAVAWFVFVAVAISNNASAQCTIPAGVDSSICGPGEAVVAATGGTKSLYNWYDAATGGTFLGTGSPFTTASIASQDTFYVAQYDTGSTTDVLTFDGTDDYIAIEDYNYAATGNAAMTVECWIKTSDGTDHIIASYDRNRYWRFEINGNGGGTGQLGFDLMTDAGQLDFGSSARVDDNVWHHVAAVYDNGTVNIYIDGSLDTTTTKGTTFGDGSTAYGYVGNGSESSTYNGPKGPTTTFSGDMDEFRIWSVARTAGQINASKDKCLTGTEAGLEVYYRMDGSVAIDSLVDHSASGNHGHLFNYTLPGAWASTGNPLTDCPNCESARDTAVVQVNAVPNPQIGNDTCALAAVTFDAGAGFTSYLWSTGETSQTISAPSTGFYYVTVTSAGTTCKGTDGATLSILAQPVGTDTSRCGPGTVTLTASGSTGKYYWYDVATGGTAVGQGSPYTSNVISETDTLYLAAIENDTTGQALTFDGINDYVSLNMVFNTVSALPTVTVEAWVKTNVSGAGEFDNWAIIDFDRSEYFSFYVHGTDGRVGFSTADNSGAIDDFYAPLANRVNDGIWHHIAGVYDGTDKLIYVDGALVATKTNPHGGLPLGDGTVRYGFIGDGSEATSENATRNNYYFQGELDEIRIWSDVRNILEIQNNMAECILGVEDDLLAYYKMENGPGSSTLTDHSNRGNDGTLRNMNTATAWINTGPVVTCSCGDSDRDTVVVEIKVVPTVDLGVDTCVAGPLLLDAGAGMTSYTWQDATTAQTLSANVSKAYHVLVDSIGTVCQGADTIIVSVGQAAEPTAVDSARCGDGVVSLVASGLGNLYWYEQAVGGALIGTGDTLNVGPLTSDSTFYVSTKIADKKNLSFDGTDDYAAIQNYNYNTNGIATFTVEAWVKIPNGDVGNHIIASFDRNEYWRFEINGDGAGPGQVGLGMLTNGGQIDMGSTGTINDGNWHHVAAVYDNGTATIYIDGSADGTTTLGTTFGTGNTRYGFLGVGSEAPDYNNGSGTQGPFNWFEGEMDEVRIWSVARSAGEINTYQDSCFAGNEAGLEVYYRLSEGSGTNISDFSGSNSAVLKGPTWASNGNAFECSLCSESDRIPIIATVHNAIDSVRQLISCPGVSGSISTVRAYGGSGKYDYRELGGVINFSNSFAAGPSNQQIPNGGNFDIEIKDENGCLDTIASIATTPGPSNNSVASGTSKTCRIPPINKWFYMTNASNEAMLAINGNGSELGEVTASVYIESNAGVVNDDAYLSRHFVVNPEFQPGVNASVRLYFTNAEYTNLVDSANNTTSTDDDITSIADLGITKYNGPTEDGTLDASDATSIVYIAQSGSGTEYGQNYIDVTVPSFSEIWVHKSGAAEPLPIELVNFQVELVESDAILTWSTASETNNKYFIVERSMDGVTFNEIMRIYGAGNSTSLLEYELIDTLPLLGESYYRLRQVDFDGQFAFSQVVPLNNDNNRDSKLTIFPNPTDGIFNLRLNGFDQYDEVEISLSDITGRPYLYIKEYTDSNGQLSMSIDQTKKLAPGQYIVLCKSANSIGSKILVIR